MNKLILNLNGIPQLTIEAAKNAYEKVYDENIKKMSINQATIRAEIEFDKVIKEYRDSHNINLIVGKKIREMKRHTPFNDAFKKALQIELDKTGTAKKQPIKNSYLEKHQ